MRTRWLAAVGCVAVVVTLGACGGGGGNNDQGVVFTAVGLVDAPANITTTTITCTDPTTTNVFVTTHEISLSRTQSWPDRNSATDDPCGGFLQVQNNLANQALNVQAVIVHYEVVGSSIAIGNNGDESITVGLTLPPANPTATVPPNINWLRLYNQVVPAQIMTFLNQNVNRLPVTPYIMNLTITAQGQSIDGTHYTTNEVNYQLTVTS
jgi:hypothetical protein